MQTCDVLIVGGGPAGSSCAWKLCKAGVDVVIVDKQQFPRNKVCAGWVTPPVMDLLCLTAEEYQSHGLLQPIRRFLTGLIGGPEMETKYDHTVSYGIRRIEFDNYLLRRSEAKLRLGEAFRSLRRERDQWVLNEEFRTPILIGAGGHFCPVARWIGEQDIGVSQTEIQSSTAQPTVVAQEVEFEMSVAQRRHCSVLPDRPELFFCHDLKGYGWIFRKGNFLNIGLGREDENELTVHVAAFIRSLVKAAKIPCDFPDHFHGHAYRLRTKLPRRTNQTGLLLIGDAAGLADCHSGEGIGPAVESGLFAAESVVEVVGRPLEELEVVYASKLKHRFDDLDWQNACNWIPPRLRMFAARWLMTSRLFTRKVVLDRWFLHVDRCGFSQHEHKGNRERCIVR